MTGSPSRARRGAVALVLTLTVLALGGTSASADTTELFFSEYIEGSSNNKALEIHNATGSDIDLASSAYKVQVFFNGSPAAGLTINLTGTLLHGDVFVLAHSSAAAAVLAQADQTNGSGWFNGDDAVALVKGTSIVDVIGQIGLDPGSEWGTGLASTADNTLRRKSTVTAGDTNGADPFIPGTQWDGFANDTFTGLGAHTLPGAPLASCGSELTLDSGATASTTVTATDSDGRIVDLDIAWIRPAPSSGSISRTAFTPASAAGGTASATITAEGALPGFTYRVALRARNDDTTPQTAGCLLKIRVKGLATIGAVQGTVTDDTNGFTHSSPVAGDTAMVRGVVYQVWRSGNNYGFFLQNTSSQADVDPNTSDGIFVFTGTSKAIDTPTVADYTPAVGDEIILSGRVGENFDLTQMGAPLTVEQVVQSFADLDAAVPAFEADPPLGLADAYRYWERREGMRAHLAAGAKTIDGTDRFGADAEQWVMRADAPVASAGNLFARRVFRDAHPLDDVVDQLFDNGNGYRILIGSGGLKGAADSATAVLTPLRTYQTLSTEVDGGVYFAFGKYAIQASQQIAGSLGIDPSTNNPPQPPGDGEYSVANYNVENLYDRRDDPTDTCDFVGPGNPGCPPSSTPGAQPFFDYVPASQAVYEEHLGAIATQIKDDLHSPDIVLVQEAEDQDICSIVDGAMSCVDAANPNGRPDGKPDTLQDAALAIASAGGPAYDAVYDRDGADVRGIVSAFLYRTDRVQLSAASQTHPVFGASPTVEYRTAGLAYNTNVQNPKVLNAVLPTDIDTSTGTDGANVFTRAPQVGLFRVWRNGIGNGVWTDVYAVSNHFSSTPDGRVGQRTEQANYVAAIAAALGADARVIIGGDFNVYPRPDDPFAPGHSLYPSDQLGAFYDAGWESMWARIAAEAPEAAYSYVFQGQTQTLDTQFLTDAIAADVVQSRVAHINADFPADFPGDGARGASDHDPLTTNLEVPVTVESLGALLAWCADNGQVSGKNTVRQLQHHLDKGQIADFISQTQEKTPEFVTESCSAALVSSAQAI